jgi:hypothetical protein
MRKSLLIIAQLFNCLLLIVAVNTIFLQTHWSDPQYVGLVVVVLGTPLVNLVTLRVFATRKHDEVETRAAPPV